MKNLLGVKMILTEDCVNGGDRFRNSKYVTSVLVQNSSKTTKKFFTFDVSTSIRGLNQKKLVLGLLLPVLGAIS